MPTNVFFNKFDHHGEQQIYEDLIVEAIRISGHDVWYIPRRINNKDPIYDADDISSFDKAYLVEMYIKSVDGFEGDGDYMSRFGGIEIRNQVVFTIAKRVFNEEIGTPEDFIRPREGDLVYFPLNKKVFQINYVDNKPFFYPFGELFTYDLYCELYEYSQEEFNTGIPEIDIIQERESTNLYDWAIQDSDGKAILDSDGNPILTSTYGVENDTIDTPTDHQDNEEIQDASDEIIDFSEIDPFSSGIY